VRSSVVLKPAHIVSLHPTLETFNVDNNFCQRHDDAGLVPSLFLAWKVCRSQSTGSPLRSALMPNWW